jgi:hypothetical protein
MKSPFLSRFRARTISIIILFREQEVGARVPRGNPEILPGVGRPHKEIATLVINPRTGRAIDDVTLRLPSANGDIGDERCAAERR